MECVWAFRAFLCYLVLKQVLNRKQSVYETKVCRCSMFEIKAVERVEFQFNDCLFHLLFSSVLVQSSFIIVHMRISKTDFFLYPRWPE